MDLDSFKSALGGIPVETNPRLVQQKSRDHYWYSPILKAQLDRLGLWDRIARRAIAPNERRSASQRPLGETGPGPDSAPPPTDADRR